MSSDSQKNPNPHLADSSNTGLLPSGLSDVLYPQAEQHDHARREVMHCFTQFGYHLVSPPLMEFEDTLVEDAIGASLSTQTFRVLDPLSHRMMGIRADMTAQVARISGTRLAHIARPLRLAYSGDVVRVAPEVLNPERQMAQAGAEIIGRDDDAAAVEIILLGAQALKSVSLEGLTVDVCLPHLAGAICAEHAEKEQLLQLVSQKDVSALLGLKDDTAAILARILQASGSDRTTLKQISSELSADVSEQLDRIIAISEKLAEIDGDIAVTLDPLDRQAEGYHSTIGFALYARGLRGAIAAGGAYITPYGEPAIGLSIYMERMQRLLPALPPHALLYISAAAGLRTALDYTSRGRQVVMGSPEADPDQEATALGCTFIIRSSGQEPEAVNASSRS